MDSLADVPRTMPATRRGTRHGAGAVVGGDVAGRARIGRTDDGVIVARDSVRRSREVIEFIAHELEHVLERIDGVTTSMSSDLALESPRLEARSRRRARTRPVAASPRRCAPV